MSVTVTPGIDSVCAGTVVVVTGVVVVVVVVVAGAVVVVVGATSAPEVITREPDPFIATDT